MIRKFVFICSTLFLPLSLFGQETSTNWESVQVFVFEKKGIPDTLQVCGGEWFVDVRASNMSQLDSKELETIKRKAAEHGCNIVFVDLKRIYKPRKGQLYILGLKKRH